MNYQTEYDLLSESDWLRNQNEYLRDMLKILYNNTKVHPDGSIIVANEDQVLLLHVFLDNVSRIQKPKRAVSKILAEERQKARKECLGIIMAIHNQNLKKPRSYRDAYRDGLRLAGDEVIKRMEEEEK